jgi:hypothetical protein
MNNPELFRNRKPWLKLNERLEAVMSDKDRQKKDHHRKDKKNKAMREQENKRKQQASPRHQAKDESNLTDSEPGAA